VEVGKGGGYSEQRMVELPFYVTVGNREIKADPEGSSAGA